MTTLRLLLGDCVDRMALLPEGSVDALICDPPYDLSPTGSSNPGRTSWAYFRTPENQEPVPEGKVRRPKKAAEVRGFMGMQWDGTGIAFSQEFWKAALRVLAPGGTVKAFGGSRTFHRMAAAMEEAGFADVRVDAWGYGSGFPKSLDVSKAIDKSKGLERKVVGTKRGVRGADGTGHEKAMPGKAVGVKQVACDVPVTAPASPEAEAWDGWGTALKPAWEPVLVGRKP